MKGRTRYLILAYLLDRQRRGQLPPTIRELTKILGYCSKNAVAPLLTKMSPYATWKNRGVVP